MILKIFQENSHYPNQENRKNHIKGEIEKLQEFTLVIIFVIFLENDNFGSKMKVLKFLGIHL